MGRELPFYSIVEKALTEGIYAMEDNSRQENKVKCPDVRAN